MTGNRLPNSIKSLTVSLAGFKDIGGTSLNFPTIKINFSLTALNGSIDEINVSFLYYFLFCKPQ